MHRNWCRRRGPGRRCVGAACGSEQACLTRMAGRVSARLERILPGPRWDRASSTYSVGRPERCIATGVGGEALDGAASGRPAAVSRLVSPVWRAECQRDSSASCPALAA
ncbi:hypothetical protein, conserved [Leishmania shawi]|uniref:Uncharacterized protein n=1 Tax=Leishmania shawi TaxID=5680 RepID=A0ABR3EBN2_9TRYP